MVFAQGAKNQVEVAGEYGSTPLVAWGGGFDQAGQERYLAAEDAMQDDHLLGVQAVVGGERTGGGRHRGPLLCGNGDHSGEPAA